MAFPMQQPNYNQQMNTIQSQLASMKKSGGFLTMTSVHQVIPVDGIGGAEAVLKDMAAGSSDIVAHRTDDIIYLIAKDENGIPLPIRPAKIERINAQDDPTGYVTKKDFEDFKNELKAIVAGKGANE